MNTFRYLTNLIFFIVIIIILVFISYNPDFNIGEFQFVTPQPKSTNATFEYLPVLITPSHVNLITPINRATADYIPEDYKNNRIVERLSPNGSVVESSIFEVNVEYPKGRFEDKNHGYVFDEINRKFSSIGEKLCCKIFEEYLQRKVVLHLRPNFLKNPLTKRNLELDIYDPITKIAIEYNGAQHYKHVPTMENDLNYQKYRDDLKVSLCVKEGVSLIVVKYTVDTTRYDKNGVLKNARLSEEEREYKLRKYIEPELDKIFEKLKIKK